MPSPYSVAETVTLVPNNRKIEISTSAAVPGSFCPKIRSKMPLGALKTLRSVSGPDQRSCPLPSRSDAGLARYLCFQVLKKCLGLMGMVSLLSTAGNFRIEVQISVPGSMPRMTRMRVRGKRGCVDGARTLLKRPFPEREICPGSG